MLIWVGILALYWQTANASPEMLQACGIDGGTFSLPEMNCMWQQGAFSETFQNLFFPFFAVGFGILAGLWPFHTWSPDGHVAAPTAVSMVHAGVLMKLGAYGIIRVGMEVTPDGAENWMPVLIGLGTVNVLYGAVSALAQRDLKYVVGYSSVSHMGYVLMGIATLHPLGLSGAVLQMFSHGIMTALFFALVGAIYDRAHVRDINVLGGLSRRMGVTASFLRRRRPCLIGAPRAQRLRRRVARIPRRVQDLPAIGHPSCDRRCHHRGVHPASVGEGLSSAPWTLNGNTSPTHPAWK